jgi:K(+)-stimulated pyrophosphate-energized sodium pump
VCATVTAPTTSAGTFVVRTKEGGNPQVALDTGAFGSAAIMAGVTFILARQAPII